MMSVAYLAALLLSCGCMLAVDRKYRLFYWADARAAWIVTAVGLVGLLVTDAAGIVLGLFARGPGEAATGIVLAPEFPLEEPVFLWFLLLCTMVCFTGTRRLIESRSAR